MATERKSPDALIAQTNLSGTVTAIVDDPNYYDANWLTAIDETADSICHVSFWTPSGNPTAGLGFQEFKILARLTGTATPCAYSIDLYESGVSIATIANGTLSSTTPQLITAVWDADQLGTVDGSAVEAHITVTSSGDTTGEIGAVEWNVTYTPPVPAESIRELILQSLQSQIANMTTGNGYDFTLATIERARRKFVDTDLPAVGLFDGDETQVIDYDDVRADMLVRVEMHGDASTGNRSTFLNKMMANLEKVLLSQDGSHGGLANGTVINNIEQRLPDDDDSTLVTVVAVARITYHKMTGDPYSQP